MLVVCEPQCTGLSHEKVNSGFLTLLHRAFPGEPIRLHTDPSHRAALGEILAHDGVVLDRIEDRELEVRNAYSIGGFVAYQRQFKRMFREAAEAGCRDVLFLSGDPVLLHIVKRLHADREFAGFTFTFVLHADFEDIANEQYAAVATTAVPELSWLAKFRSIQLSELPSKAAGLVTRKLSARYAQIFQTRYRARDQLLWRHSDAFHYIALSPHIVANAATYVDVGALHIRAVEMPINFAPVPLPPVNDHVKFATFGIGDPAALRQVVEHLDRLPIERPYEIRIIGMDNRGVENHPHVHCPSPGKRLARADMERHAADIDAFLILYGPDRYRLSCSGSIFEALSYVKPVLHIRNPCIEPFDRPEAPIGFPCADLAELARMMAAMIEDYPGHRVALDERRRNIVSLRQELVTNRAARLGAAFPHVTR